MEGMELDWTRQLLVCADDIKLLGENIHVMSRNAETVLVASKEVA
jgi:hypothetical protein